ncbi:MAG TPA: methyltransferase [Gammaproteobacteria bacterium]|nr:methyltransferase [Gammaproteobacteria bacterium]
MKSVRMTILASAALVLQACAEPGDTESPAAASPAADETTRAERPGFDTERPPVEAIAKAVDGEHRTAEARARDEYRHPAETLDFFGIEEDMTVVELWPGAGWYTEILAPLLRERGKLVVASFGEGAEPEYRAGLHAGLMEKFASNPDLYDRVEVVILAPPDAVQLGEPESADLVLTFRNTHNWIEAGVEEEVYRAAYEVLKPGGVFGVVQHRGKPGQDAADSAPRGYVPEQHVIDLAGQVGFELAASSEINANPKDTKDYEEGVWTLPPAYRLKDQDRERYAEIGESDRMTLRFVKPRAAP